MKKITYTCFQKKLDEFDKKSNDLIQRFMEYILLKEKKKYEWYDEGMIMVGKNSTWNPNLPWSTTNY